MRSLLAAEPKVSRCRTSGKEKVPASTHMSRTAVEGLRVLHGQEESIQ